MLISDKNSYPLLKNGLIYFDNSSLMPMHSEVINKVQEAMCISAPVGRGIYHASENATELYNNARIYISNFINAQPEEVSFTLNSSYALNILANSFSNILQPGDEILISDLEHHSNFLPWIELAKKNGYKIKKINSDLSNGFAKIDINNLKELITKKTKILSFTAVSNVIGYREPVEEIINIAKKNNIFTVVDAAQYVPHYKTDVKKWQADAVIFSGHKLGSLPGTGVLYINKEYQQKLRPVFFGGGMVQEVNFNNFTYLENSSKFEVGTPALINVLSLQYAQELYSKIDFVKLGEHEQILARHLENYLNKKKIKILSAPNSHLVTFVLDKHPHDFADWCDANNIAVRVGDHCAQPLHKMLNLRGSIRVSFGPYNSIDEVDKFIQVLGEFNHVK